MSDSAGWEVWFGLRCLRDVQRALRVPNRTVALIDDAAGVPQVNLWDLEAGAPRQLSDADAGTGRGWLSPDGRWALWLADESGSDLGRIVARSTSDDSELSVDGPSNPYALMDLNFARASDRMLAVTVDADGFHLAVTELGPDGPGGLEFAYSTAAMITGARLSVDGRWAAATVIVPEGDHSHKVVEVIDLASGEVETRRTGGAGEAEARAVSRQPGGTRVLVNVEDDGYVRPALWDFRSGESTPLPVAEVEGDVIALDWSPSERTVLLCSPGDGGQELHLHDLETGATTKPAHVEAAVDHLDRAVHRLGEHLAGKRLEALSHRRRPINAHCHHSHDPSRLDASMQGGFARRPANPTADLPKHY